MSESRKARREAAEVKPDAANEAAFNEAAAQIGIVFTRRRPESLYLNRIVCLTCNEVWEVPAGFRVRQVGWYRRESPPLEERVYRFSPLVRECFRCPNGCNAPVEA